MRVAYPQFPPLLLYPPAKYFLLWDFVKLLSSDTTSLTIWIFSAFKTDSKYLWVSLLDFLGLWKPQPLLNSFYSIHFVFIIHQLNGWLRIFLWENVFSLPARWEAFWGQQATRSFLLAWCRCKEQALNQ